MDNQNFNNLTRKVVIRPYECVLLVSVECLNQPLLTNMGNAAHYGLVKRKVESNSERTPRINSEEQKLSYPSVSVTSSRAPSISALPSEEGDQRRRSNPLRALSSAGLGEVSAEGEHIRMAFQPEGTDRRIWKGREKRLTGQTRPRQHQQHQQHPPRYQQPSS